MAREVSKTLEQVEAELNSTPVEEAKKDKRTLLIERDAYGMYSVRQSTGGKIPDLLKGKFTSISQLNTLIHLYESK